MNTILYTLYCTPLLLVQVCQHEIKNKRVGKVYRGVGRVYKALTSISNKINMVPLLRAFSANDEGLWNVIPVIGEGSLYWQNIP